MTVSREDKKIEALVRMKMLGIFPGTIKQFEKEDYVSASEPPFGAFYWAEGEDLQRIRNFEARYNALTYLVIRSYTTVGKMDSYLYVSDYRDEWMSDRKDLQNGTSLCYVYSYDMPDCSEFGCIGIEKTSAAGLRRTW